MTRTILRRLPIALGATLAVAVLAGALFAAASPGAAAADLPERFQLASRMGGDAGSWEVSYTSDAPEMEVTASESADVVHSDSSSSASATGVDDAMSFRSNFEWFPEQAWQDGAGRWHAVHGHFTVDPDHGNTATSNGVSVFTPNWRVDWVSTATGDSLGRTSTGGGGASSSSSLLGGEQSMTYVNVETEWIAEAGCSLSSTLRLGVDLDAAIQATDCLGDGTFRAVAVDTIGGTEAVRFDSHGEDIDVSYWYNPGIPDPVRVLVVSTYEDGTTVTSDQVLTSFTRGTLAWDTGLALPADAVVPALELAERQPWGPDDSGIDHPFPASAAWVAARDDLRFTEFGDFLEAHPEAAATEASYVETTRGSAVEHAWEFVVAAADGSGFRLMATQTVQPADGQLADLLGQPARAPPTATFEANGHESDGGFLELADLPAALPTATSLLAFWEAVNGTAGNTYGLEGCHHPCEGVVATAGLARFTFPTSGEGSATDSRRAFLPDGTPAFQRDVDAQLTAQAGLLRAGPAVAGASVIESKSAGVRVLEGAISPWDLPPAAAVGVGFAALLSGILAFLWPALKASPVLGLFSRLQPDRILDHPVRARVLRAVEAQPGVHYQELLRQVGGGKGALEHHLRTLEGAGHVAVERSGGYACYFPRGTRPSARQAAPALKSDGARKVLSTIRGEPGIRGQDVAERTGLSPSSVSEHVARLSGAGLVLANRAGRSVHLELTAAGQAAAGAA